MCEICENMVYLAKSIASRVNMNYHANSHSLVETYSCDTVSENCMNSVCMNCRETGLKVEDFDDEDDAVVFYKWKRVDSKVKKIEMSLSPVEACPVVACVSLRDTFLLNGSSMLFIIR